jgi:hypothetical protein
MDLKIFVGDQDRRPHVVEDVIEEFVGFPEILRIDGHGAALALK